MECKCYLKQLIWFMVTFQLALLSATVDDTAMQNINVPEGLPPDHQSYAWSSWSSWSPCSRSCGRGVSVQKRYCLPRNQSVLLNTTLPTPVITVRVTRQVENCVGVARRFHECNTEPCPGTSKDTRAEQCSVYDRRPFRGRFYTWVPYIDGNAPCVLNCRPLGQQFYARLALVADGTPCTKPGVRAICVQGFCNVVGLESVLAAAGDSELACGHRLVSGLFNRPRLPLGYTYVTTIPRGACHLNITELVASENFIALKVTNGSYIINGEFAVSAPGTFDAAGARFHYSRTGGRDRIISMGPIYNPVDIMVLFTQPAPSIKYEYFSEALPGEIATDSFTQVNATELKPTTRHMRRHHSSKHSDYGTITDLFLNHVKNNDYDIEENKVGLRRFTWKIQSFSQCSRTCGGGIQIGKYRCIEGVDKEVSPVHCPGAPPGSRRRRCNNAACPARWRAAAWAACPRCGPASRTRVVGCVQDHARGIVKIKDRMCPDPKPNTIEKCLIPDCEAVDQTNGTTILKFDSDVTDNFREGPIYSVAVNDSNIDGIGPVYNMSPMIGWIYTNWSECVGTCAFGGVQSRGARCADPAGCAPRSADTARACRVSPACRADAAAGQWLLGEWSPCSSDCGGWQVRAVVCAGGAGSGVGSGAGSGAGSVAVLPAAACRGDKPASRRACGGSCSRHAWFYSDWTPCMGNCSLGFGWQQRSVVCAAEGKEETWEGARGEAREGAGKGSRGARCAGVAPDRRQPCALACARAPHDVTPATVDKATVEYHTTPRVTTSTTTTESNNSPFKVTSKRCEDLLPNCGLALQARLCHYNYYTKNCCQSCRGRM